MLVKAGIQKTLKFLDSGSHFLQMRISVRLKLSPAMAFTAMPGPM